MHTALTDTSARRHLPVDRSCLEPAAAAINEGLLVFLPTRCTCCRSCRLLSVVAAPVAGAAARLLQGGLELKPAAALTA